MREQTKQKLENALSFMKDKSSGNFIIGTVSEVVKDRGLSGSYVKAIKALDVLDIQKACQVGLDIRDTQGAIINPLAVAYKWKGPSKITPDFMNAVVKKVKEELLKGKTTGKKVSSSKVQVAAKSRDVDRITKTVSLSSEQLSVFSAVVIDDHDISVNLGDKLKIASARGIRMVKDEEQIDVLQILGSDGKVIVEMKPVSKFNLIASTIRNEITSISIKFV